MLRSVEPSRLHRLYYPVVATVITSADGKRIAAMVAASCIPLSASPPLLGVAISPGHRTHKIIRASKLFAVNWLDSKYLEKVLLLASPTEKGVKNKPANAGLETAEGRALRVPVLKDAVAVAECMVSRVYALGDHDLFVGECVAAYASDDFGECWRYENYEPILYVGLKNLPGSLQGFIRFNRARGHK